MLVGGGGRNAERCFWGHVVAGVHERLAVCCSEREGKTSEIAFLDSFNHTKLRYAFKSSSVGVYKSPWVFKRDSHPFE